MLFTGVDKNPTAIASYFGSSGGEKFRQLLLAQFEEAETERDDLWELLASIFTYQPLLAKMILNNECSNGKQGFVGILRETLQRSDVLYKKNPKVLLRLFQVCKNLIPYLL